MAELGEREVTAVLRDIARVAAVMFDGEMCHDIYSEHGMAWLGRDAPPQDRYAITDNIDFNAPVFEAAKKVLLRLQRLAPAGVKELQCFLWVPVAGRGGAMAAAVYNGGASRWWQPSMTWLEAPEPLRRAMETGEPVELGDDGSGVATILAPVRDSLKEVAGLIEVSAVVGKGGKGVY